MVCNLLMVGSLSYHLIVNGAEGRPHHETWNAPIDDLGQNASPPTCRAAPLYLYLFHAHVPCLCHVGRGPRTGAKRRRGRRATSRRVASGP